MYAFTRDRGEAGGSGYISNSALLISNCTGVSHIADATKTPSVVISMDEEPGRWSSLNKALHKTIDCKSGTRFDDVPEATEQLLEKNRPLNKHLV